MPKHRVPAAPAGQYSVWLLPDHEQEAGLVDTITRLSILLGGASFAPHVTVQGGIALPPERLHEPVQHLATRLAALRWQVRQAECSAHFFRCLYLRLDDRPEFASMQRAMRGITGTRVGLSPFPHLSLAYGEPHPDNIGMRRLLSEEFDSRHIVFDRLAIIRSSGTIPIREWECLTEFPLTAL